MTPEEKKIRNSEYRKKWYLKNKEKFNKERKVRTKKYYQNNKEKIDIKNKEYYEKNKKNDNYKNKVKEYREKNKEKLKEYYKNWRNQNKEKRNQKERKRFYSDNLFRLSTNTRAHISRILKENKFPKKSKICDIIGCSFEDLKLYLESKWLDWMTWENYGKYNGNLNSGWDIDHIIPLSSVESEEELLKLFHYTNLQPLCSYINRNIKKNKLN